MYRTEPTEQRVHVDSSVLAALVSLRDRVLVLLLYSAGLRLAEVCHLRVRDIDSSRMLLHIAGKGRKDRYVPLSPVVLALLRDWWRATRPHDLLFTNQKDPSRSINRTTVQRVVPGGGTCRADQDRLSGRFVTRSRPI